MKYFLLPFKIKKILVRISEIYCSIVILSTAQLPSDLKSSLLSHSLSLTHPTKQYLTNFYVYEWKAQGLATALTPTNHMGTLGQGSDQMQ